jgi:UMF1 family MFS transporter
MNASDMTNRRGQIAWAFYDWANSAFPTVILTFVFATFFTQKIAENEITGTSQWGYAMSLSALAVAVVAPILGAIADNSGRRKPWLGGFTLMAVISSALLWFAEPNTTFILWALVFAGLGNFAFESGMVFYNAMLPDICKPERFGRLSGWAWGLGYAGGLSCLVIALFGFAQAERPWFGLSKEGAENIRGTATLVAVWFIVFSLPLFLFTPDKPATGVPFGQAVRDGWTTLIGTFRNLRQHAQTARYLIARMIYTDGLNTIFAFGGIYAAGSFGFTFEQIITFGIAINVTAGLGAVGFAWVDDKIGAKTTILWAVAGLTVFGIALLIIESQTMFWVFGLGLGIFVGPAQAASRSLMAHLAPAELRTEMFGLYALSGKATAFLGPLVLALFTDMFQSQRAGMATIIVFFMVGGALMLGVRAPKQSEEG